jgi:hypothetical protein
MPSGICARAFAPEARLGGQLCSNILAGTHGRSERDHSSARERAFSQPQPTLEVRKPCARTAGRAPAQPTPSSRRADLPGSQRHCAAEAKAPLPSTHRSKSGTSYWAFAHARARSRSRKSACAAPSRRRPAPPRRPAKRSGCSRQAPFPSKRCPVPTKPCLPTRRTARSGRPTAPRSAAVHGRMRSTAAVTADAATLVPMRASARPPTVRRPGQAAGELRGRVLHATSLVHGCMGQLRRPLPQPSPCSSLRERTGRGAPCRPLRGTARRAWLGSAAARPSPLSSGRAVGRRTQAPRAARMQSELAAACNVQQHCAERRVRQTACVATVGPQGWRRGMPRGMRQARRGRLAATAHRMQRAREGTARRGVRVRVRLRAEF